MTEDSTRDTLIAAARAAGARLVVIRRPEEETDGLSYEQALDACRKAVDPCKRSR